MSEQEHPLRKAVTYLLGVLGYKSDCLDNEPDKNLEHWIWRLSSELKLVRRLFALNLKGWEEACQYVSELEDNDLVNELALDDDALKNKFNKPKSGLTP